MTRTRFPTYNCDQCGTECVGIQGGYITGCEHNPPDVQGPGWILQFKPGMWRTKANTAEVYTMVITSAKVYVSKRDAANCSAYNVDVMRYVTKETELIEVGHNQKDGK